MSVNVEPSGQACGATITGVDLRDGLTESEIAAVREAWLAHHVVAFPGQDMNDDDLERFSLQFGDFGVDPFIAPIEGREHIIAVQRAASETAPIFAESWHTDWSFQQTPPAATCLYGITIPPRGGDTWFTNQHMALDEMPESLRSELENRFAIHSAKNAYAPEGMYGESDQDTDRSMEILPSEDARDTQLHPLIKAHPETGRPGIFGCFGYIVGIDQMADEPAMELLTQLYNWQTQPRFQYHHAWQPGMLVMWDNRSVLHRATGGYEGHDRLLHRTTIAGL
jgi:alpha-ketoglutarate-dependent taurine dioxygenase